MVIRPSHIRWIVFGTAILLSLPFLPDPFSGLYLWASPDFLLISLISGKGLVWLHIPGLVTLAVVLFRKRWICRYACPAGVVCDLSSDLGRNVKIGLKMRLNKYLAIISLVLAIFGTPVLILLDPFNLFFMAFEGARTGIGPQSIVKLSGLVFLILFSLLFPHVWCSSVCPLGGLQLLLYDLRKNLLKQPFKPEAGSKDRRLFLAGAAGIVGGLIFPRLFPVRAEKVIRPPFSLPESKLNMVCARCGNCSSVCPTDIISQHVDILQPERFLTPVVSFEYSYCLPECNSCGNICPSGAIRTFTPDNKKNHVMGVAVIHLDHCYQQHGRECDLCRRHCDYDAIEFGSAIQDGSRLPRVVEEHCVGCGACQVICPPHVIKIVV